MYTTTLDKGFRTRELEEKAGGEIEAENTGDLRVAEERGLQINEKFDTDEEAKYSAVRPVDGFDDSGFDEEDGKLLDTCNDQTFGGSSTSIVQKPTSSSGKSYGGESQPFQNETNVDQSCSISDDHAGHLPSEQRSKDFPAQGSSSTSESQLGEQINNNNPEVAHSNRTPEESVSGSGHGEIEEGANLGGGGGGTSASKTVAEKESQVSGKTKSESSFGQSASRRRSSESCQAPSTSTRPGLSPSSSISSLPSSEKSILNPNAKEFKPSQSPAPVRPAMPAGYGLQIQPQYPPGEQQMLRYPRHEYPETYYPPNAPPWFHMQQQPGLLHMVYMPLLPPLYQPENPHNQG
ncbi:hypothetical protein N665_0478s0011 [Sinapis alba]|nr:hypothetical protein N665_0478s0011 [Sinapis alba]KAF8090350.1 hypothetical protein N665_0478s0011 [Sinapis alba]